MFDEPDLEFLGLSLWVEGLERDVLGYGSQDDSSSDPWGNGMLWVRAVMKAQGAHVEWAGPLHAKMDIENLRSGLVAIMENIEGEVMMDPVEPWINLKFAMKGHGHLEATVEIMPDYQNQLHRFVLEADQSYIPPLISSCNRILARYPRGD